MDTELSNMDRLQKLAEQFADRLDEGQFACHIEDHEKRIERAQHLLSADQIDSLSEDDLQPLFTDTDAFRFWSNPEKHFQDVLEEVGVANIRQALQMLVEVGDEMSPETFQAIRQKGLPGPLLLTELLHYRYPDTYYTYSPNVTLEALKHFGADIKEDLPHGEKSNPYIYRALRPIMDTINNTLRDAGVDTRDYILTDIFLWWIHKEVTPEALPTRRQLAEVIEQRARTEETLEITTRFVERIVHYVQEAGEEVETRHAAARTPHENPQATECMVLYSIAGLPVPVSTRDSTQPINVQARVAGAPTSLLFWGIYAHGGGEFASNAEKVITDRQLVPDWAEQPRNGRKMLGLPKGGGGGRYFAAGHFRSPEDIRNRDELDKLAEQIAADLIYCKQQLQPHEEDIRTAMEQLAEAQTTPETSDRKYWKISPGEGAKIWDECREGDMIALGWSEVGDMSHIEPTGEDDLKRRPELQEAYDHGGKAAHAADMLWTLYSEMQPGHWVFAYGNKHVLAWGTITGDYHYDPDDDLGYRHRRHVEWHKTDPVSTDELSSELAEKLAGYSTIIALTEAEGNKIQKAMTGSDGEHQVHIVPLSVMSEALENSGFRFNDWQIASFYTALQTKGFVILSGISGTGKTKLAQHFARMLPQPDSRRPAPDDIIDVTVQPYMLEHHRVVIPTRYRDQLTLPERGSSLDVDVQYRRETRSCALRYPARKRNDQVTLYFRGTPRDWPPREDFSVGNKLRLIPNRDDEGNLTHFRLLAPEERPNEALTEDQSVDTNFLFLPVRPDWRDSKPLLGYYNPLTNTYEWTEFLRFIVRADESYENGDELAWFVLLDEMNLAHVEYYFADLLSVLESGRDGDTGRTKEPLRFDYPDRTEGETPPEEIHLPPNLYFLGTVNVDETTKAFSPKVLDRAFTIEFTHVDFSGYPEDLADTTDDIETETSRALLNDFTRDGRFVRIDKERVSQAADEHPQVGPQLQKLINLLKRDNLHFGYRVFDEIHSFLGAADDNGTFEGVDGSDAALDAAILMKVLPKFHGSRARLEQPLCNVLAWCRNPDGPDGQEIDQQIDQQIEAGTDTNDAGLPQISREQYRLNRTAKKAMRMLRDLYTDGFTSFG